MHISEGVLSGPVLACGGVLAAGLTAAGLRRLEGDRLVRVGLFSSAFYLASLVHVPLGPGNVHLVLNGLLGVVLGWAAVPAILVGLLLQAVMFQFGGLTVLGVNVVIMGLPAVLCHLLLGPWLRRGKQGKALPAFCCGALAILLSGLLASLALVSSGEAFMATAGIILAAHVPVMLVEGCITAFLVGFLARVKPELLTGC